MLLRGQGCGVLPAVLIVMLFTIHLGPHCSLQVSACGERGRALPALLPNTNWPDAADIMAMRLPVFYVDECIKKQTTNIQAVPLSGRQQ